MGLVVGENCLCCVEVFIINKLADLERRYEAIKEEHEEVGQQDEGDQG